MNFYCLITLSALMLSLSSCHNRNEIISYNNDSITKYVKEAKYFNVYSDEVQKIDISKDFDNVVNLSVLIDSIWYVRLETSSKSLIVNIDKIIVHDNYIFVSSLIYAKSISIFEKNGKHLRTLYPGHGPGEFLYPEFFTLNKYSNTIEVTDHTLHKVFVYDLQGYFVKSIPTRFRFSKYYHLPNGQICSHTYNRLNDHWPEVQNYRLVVTDSSMSNITGLGLKYDYIKDKITALKDHNSFMFEDGFPLIVEPFSDSIFMVDSDQLKLKYLLDYGGYKASETRYNFNSAKDYLSKFGSSGDHAIFTGNFLKDSEHIFILSSHNNRNICSFYNSKTREITTGSSMDMTNIRNALFYTPPISVTQGAYVCVLQASDVHIISQEWKKNDQIEKYRDKGTIKFVMDTKENDNPILMFYKMK